MSLFDRCPICKSAFKHCPHSVKQVQDRAATDRIRKIVQQELAKQQKAAAKENNNG